MAEPAWKVAMRERKKKKEEEEKKKQAEEEAKLASMPGWKRAMLEKKGKLPGAGTSGAATTPAPSTVSMTPATTASKTPLTTASKTPATSSSDVVNKWRISAVNKKDEPLPATPASKPATEQTSTVPTWKTRSTRVSAAKNLFEERANSPQIPKKTPLSPVRQSLLEPLDKSSNIAHMKEQFEKKPEHNEIVSDHEDVDAQQSNTEDITETPSSPTKPSAPSPTLTHHSHSVKEEEQQKTDPSPPTTNVSQSSGVTKPAFTAQRKISYNTRVVEPPAETDKIPEWKRALLARKKGKKKETPVPPQQSTEVEPSSSPPAQSLSIPPPVSTTPGLATASSSTVTPTAAPEPEEKKSEPVKKPEIVNASDKKDGGDSPKLLNKEGKSIRAPVLKSTSKWADIKEEDPEFQKLPMWKQELIKRRRKDMENRTAPIPKEEKKEEKKAPPSLPSSLSTPFERMNAQKESSLETSKKPSHNLTPIKKTPSPPTTSQAETAETSNISALAGIFGGSLQNIKKRPPPASPVTQNGDSYTMIDEESSDDEPSTPKHVMKTARSSSILKVEGKVQTLYVLFIHFNMTSVRLQSLDSLYSLSNLEHDKLLIFSDKASL